MEKLKINYTIYLFQGIETSKKRMQLQRKLLEMCVILLRGFEPRVVGRRWEGCKVGWGGKAAERLIRYSSVMMKLNKIIDTPTHQLVSHSTSISLIASVVLLLEIICSFNVFPRYVFPCYNFLFSISFSVSHLKCNQKRHLQMFLQMTFDNPNNNDWNKLQN